ncbi:hypothetical protein B4065_1370 [Caldibacillus thermoamylovorans]|uniref:hypothetical protein n=1 Tax=Caldibacillus thermoamylovorans TaxID=35841 RepID=UPI0005A497B1|nr:hypothetical protein [Caldibacillus thermoamylovorans]KIO69704.1 hypothetical protein B4065_1370 [Caldibacillus thermoamylovorans]
MLSYDGAKHYLFSMALYLVGVSIVIKGLGFLLESNIIGFFGDIIPTDMSLPFNFDTLSFEGLLTVIKDKLHQLFEGLMPVALGLVEVVSVSTLKLTKTSSVFVKV